jgi:signal transduction histidine kinase
MVAHFPWHRLRGRPFLADSLLAAALTAISVFSLWVTVSYIDVDFREPDALGVLLTTASALPVAWRRRYPLTVLVITGLATVLISKFNYAQSASGVGLLIALYTMAAYTSRRRSLAALIAAVVFLVAALIVDHVPVGALDLVASSAIIFGAWAFGRSIGIRRVYTAELEQRAHRLERAREADVRAIVAEERNRIARELHDVVGHHVSVMTVQAAAAQRTLDRDPARACEAIAAIESTGREALAEMRRIVGVLRTSRTDEQPDTDLAPLPGVNEIDRLAEQVREAGLDVSVRVDGAPALLTPGIDVTVYRIVQEALTNTLKHARARRADVVLRYRPTELLVRVSDDGHGLAAALAKPAMSSRSSSANGARQTGHGLLGMRERVTLYGGRLHTGPRSGGGYEVVAHLPLPSPRHTMTGMGPAMGPAWPP